MQTYIRETTTDRDYYRKETLTLIDKKLKLEQEKLQAFETFKAQT